MVTTRKTTRRGVVVAVVVANAVACRPSRTVMVTPPLIKPPRWAVVVVRAVVVAVAVVALVAAVGAAEEVKTKLNAQLPQIL
jgi:hypothetical protein